MHLPRRLLWVLSMVSVVVAAGAGYYVVQRQHADVALLRLYIDIGLMVTLALIVVGTTGARPQLLADLAEALRALSLGDHDRRLDASDYGSLEDVARAYNEAAAALSEMDDPNLGPVKTKPRADQRLPKDSKPPVQVTEPRKTSRKRQVQRSAAQEDALSDHPELGAVRPLRKAPTAEEATAASDEGDAAEERQDAESQPAENQKPTAAKASEAPSDSNNPERLEESLDKTLAPDDARLLAELGTLEAPDVEDQDDEAPTILEPAPPQEEEPSEATATAPGEEQTSTADASEAPAADNARIYPTRSELRELFDAFVAQKKEVDADVSDLEFESFADTLEDESRRLVEDHKCRGIRFEITIDSGEVSLLPHLLR